ncbi:hypothetical protein K2173_022456 [Erythroxylum novogranatense]|uniref:CASP-like protein n=1 Tax=Erythroxylum novogranatense TaxID=1862640 RepID=A0AAV8THU2_9ROSI|nr:hypothetical protein K2173_022456 [Erythroxylum novogranatense]
MASTDKPDPEPVKYSTTQPPPLSIPYVTNTFVVDVALRVVLFAATLVALVVMITSKQTKVLVVQGFRVPVDAKFDHSPAFVYFVVAMSVACLYSIITGLASFGVISKPAHTSKFLLHFAFWDVIMLGIVASATGSAAGVAYIGLKGNSHVGWVKICNMYHRFCRHIGTSVFFSLFASIVLIFLIMLSILSIHRRIRQ